MLVKFVRQLLAFGPLDCQRPGDKVPQSPSARFRTDDHEYGSSPAERGGSTNWLISRAPKNVTQHGTAIDKKIVGRHDVRKIVSHQLQMIDVVNPITTAGQTDRRVHRDQNMPMKNIAASGPTNMLKNFGIMSMIVNL